MADEHGTREDNRPSFAFFPDDWLTDSALAISEPAEKGIWIDMLCYMFKSPVRGAMLNPNGSKMTTPEMAKLLRIPEKVMANVIGKLVDNKVARRLEDGTIVNWRMYRKDKDLSQKRREAGFQGAVAKWQEDGKNRLPLAKSIMANDMANDGKNTLSPTINEYGKQDGKKMARGGTNDGKDGLTEKKKNIEEVKDKYLEFVYLSSKQFKQLEDRFGKERTQEYIERLNNYIGSKGIKYKSHYHTILNWANKDGQEGKGGTSKTGGLSPEPGKYAKAIAERAGEMAESEV
ncbi:MAG: hypothetical protein PHV98_07280 [Candidatus Omnitrophica bacterium]|nr:hypothetical protein [Candidatus Omnitrophota bacterium]